LLSVFVLPKITKLFSSFKTTLPFTTRAIIAVSDFITAHTFWVLAGLATVVLVMPFLLRLSVFRPFTHRLLLRLPVIRRFSRNFNIALFCRTLGTLSISGVPINQALQITSETMRNVVYTSALQDIVTVQQTGETLGALLRQYPHMFPPMVYRMISVGEESGNMEEILLFLADFHEKEIDYLSKNLTSIMEPVLLITIGLAVAVVALGIITPIYQITGSFQFQ
jgi:type II secretory pathway component PulF